MPRFAHLQLYQVHIADGFSSDCDDMVHKCLQLKTLDFQEFSKIWKAMNFDLLYQGRSSSAEIAELSEEMIQIAKYYMVKDTSYYEESVTGLFIVYSLLNLQPFSGFACLRITPNDVNAINRIELVARRERRLDILYILGEVLVKWTQYHVTDRPRGMELVIRKYLEGYTSMDRLGVRPRGVFYRQNEELDHIRDLGSAERQYKLAKKALFGDAPNVASLKYINENLAGELNASLRKLISGIIDDCEDPELNDPDSSEDEAKTSDKRSKTVHAIKEKAMTNVVDPMNHLVTAEERKKSTTSPWAKSDLKNPTGKVKSSSHTQITIPPPGKKVTEVITKGKPNRDVDIEHSENGTNGNCDADDNNAVLDIEKFQKAYAGNNERNLNLTTQDLLQRLSELPGLDIQIEALPLILRPGDLGDEIEIEIIDHVKSKWHGGDKIPPKNSSNATTSSSEDDEPLSVKAGIIKTYNKNKRDRKQIEVNEPPFPVKKKEKREQIRRELKSKFKRLGMLPVANFEDQATNVQGANEDKDKASTK